MNIGFWRKNKDDTESTLPFPIENQDNYIDGFLEKITLWKNASTVDDILYKGVSKCRICNCKNGAISHIYKGYRFPSGYIHYILEHKIYVPIEFQEMIVNNDVPYEKTPDITREYVTHINNLSNEYDNQPYI